MCKEDIREGRRTYSRFSQKTIAAGSEQPIVPEDANRVHLYIQATGAGLRMTPQGSASIGVPCFFSDSTAGPFDWDIKFHGDIVTWGWSGSGNGGNSLVAIMETFWADPDK